MRRQGRRMGGSRGRKKFPTQWVTSATGWSNAGSTILVGTTLGLELCGASGVAAQSDPPILQRYRIERVVGQYTLVVTGDPSTLPMTFGVGVIVVRGSTAGGYALPNPLNQEDAGMNWLHIKLVGFYEEANLSLQLSDVLPTGTFIDTRTKRIMKENERLYLILAIAGAGSTGGYYVVPAMRTLISHVA